jgi:hypothetical protein
MVVERMNELSIMVERVALPCVLAVRCTAWMNLVYSSCHRGVSLLGGATSSSMIRGDSETECLLKELDDGAFDDRVFLGKKLVAIFHIVVALTHNECTGGCLPVGKTHKRSIWRVKFIIIIMMIIIFCEMHKIGLI